MSILCGTDFSDGARGAVRVAAALAGRRNECLHLVHAIDVPMPVAWYQGLQEHARRAATRELRNEARTLRELGTVAVEESLVEGLPHEILASTAEMQQASLIVLGAAGAVSQLPIGRTAERVAAAARVPVLVVRSLTAIEEWLRGTRSLKVVVGDDLTFTSEAALRWTSALMSLGRCDIVVCHVFWLIGEKSRLGLQGSPYTRIPEIEAANLAALQRHVAPILGAEGVRFRVEATLGRSAEPLLAVAFEEEADLLVVGTKQRSGLDRMWHGSSSQIVLGKAQASVACIPAGENDTTGIRPVAPIRRVLVATDFSHVANHAVAYAYAIVAPGGAVHILHVEEQEGSGKDVTVERLQRLVPGNASRNAVETRFEVVSGSSAAAAITAAAERLDVDVVCMGTHGRSGMATILLGSVAREVAERCRRQVLLVPPRRE